MIRYDFKIYWEKNSLRFFALHWFIQFQFGWFLCLSVYAIYENIFNWQRSHWPAVLTGKNSSSKLFLIRTIILREELGRFEPILHCPDWGRYSAIHIHIPQCDMVNQLSRIWMEKWWEIRLLETIIVPEMVSKITSSTYDLPCVWRWQEVGCMLGVDTQSGVLTTTETRLGART